MVLPLQPKLLLFGHCFGKWLLFGKSLTILMSQSYLHSKKIVHCDVKTENVLPDASRNLKIADFGVACVEAQNPSDMTSEIGTLGYMAPEVLEGRPYNQDAAYTTMAYTYGKSIALTCLTQILALMMCHLLLLDRTYNQRFQDVVQILSRVSCTSAGMQTRKNGLKWLR